MKLYANVVIDISSEKLDKIFQYEVPGHLQKAVYVGVQVLVPFGNGGKRRRGYVVGLTEKARYDPEKIKEIDQIDDAGMPIESQLIGLAAWIRRNYGSTMNQALKTVIPVRQRSAKKEKKRICLLLEKEEAKERLAFYKRRHSTARERLLAALLEDPQLDYEVVTGKLNVSASVVRALEEQGVLSIDRLRDYRNPVQGLTQKSAPVALNAMQTEAVRRIRENAKSFHPKPCLIHGVTGSGKTEVYMELIKDAVKEGKQSIVLIPEIALTYQTVMRFYNCFGARVSILNSRMSQGERYDQFERAKKGELDVMIGPRSALFTPFPNLGYIVIDEEHEGAYKSETMPRYHARETAIQRAKMAGAVVVLCSATPSTDSYYRACAGEYMLVEMHERVHKKQLPACEIIDLRTELRERNFSILSRKLQELIEDRLKKREQVMLFLNRRGISGFVSCRSCGHVVKCPHCDISLSAHGGGKLVCHYCGYETPMVLKCPACGSPYISGFKAGTEKIEQTVKARFPDARVLRMDMDTTRKKDAYEKILSAFANQEADILIGTQMIVKGHDFKNVTLVGVLAADLSLYVGDYRASERTFQLIAQAIGRAGRGEKEGEAVIQTYSPDHYSVRAAAASDYGAFYEAEMMYRRMMRYPPVWNLLVILVASEKEELASAAAKYATEYLEASNRAQISKEELLFVGPAKPAVAKVNDIYKRVLYLKCRAYDTLVQIKDHVETYMQSYPAYREITMQFDFNPMNGF